MKIEVRDEILLLNAIVVVLILTVIFIPSNVVRVPLGSILILFLPGYAVIAALFPGKETLKGVERIVLSCSLSLALVPLIGFILSLTPWGMRLEPLLYSLSSFVLIVSAVAWLRRRQLPESERLSMEIKLSRPRWRGGAFDKVVSGILIMAVLGVLATVGYVTAQPTVDQEFTDFYILDVDGQASSYPKRVVVGQEVSVTVGIVNHEHETVSYSLVVMLDGSNINQTGPVELRHDEKWEHPVSFTPLTAGDRREVELLLYRAESDESYLRPLRLWVDVVE